MPKSDSDYHFLSPKVCAPHLLGRIGYSLEKNKQTQSEHVSIRAQKSQVTVTNSIGLSFFLGKLIVFDQYSSPFCGSSSPNYSSILRYFSFNHFSYSFFFPQLFSYLLFKPFLPLCLSLLFSPCFGQNIERERESMNINGDAYTQSRTRKMLSVGIPS